MKCLEKPSFQPIKHGKNTSRYEAPKLWNMLENKFKNVADLILLNSQFMGRPKMYVFLLLTMCFV